MKTHPLPLLLALACCALPFAGCRRQVTAAPLDRYNLVLINIDTLRADHLGCYGYPRDTSPFLDELAAGGVLFANAAANSSYTRESVAALFTGLLPSRSGARGWDAHPPRAARTLAEVLGEAGYETVFLSLTTMLTHQSFTRGFDQFEHLTEKWGLSRAGPQLSTRALEVLRTRSKRPFFLYLHYLDPHGPYDPPAEALARFPGTPPPSPLALYHDVRGNLPALRESGFGPEDARFLDLVRRYDAEIYDTDRAIRLFVDGLRQSGELDRTLLVVTADHGEEFLEHGFVEHAWTLYEESIRVPLILWAGDRLPPMRVSSRVSGVDVFPTVLGLLGIAGAPRALDGKPVLRLTSAGPELDAAERVQISELLIEKRNVLRSVHTGDWKYLSMNRWLSPAARSSLADAERKAEPSHAEATFDPWAPPIAEELYDLRRDPAESRNLVDAEPAIRTQMRAELSAHRERCTAPPESMAGPTLSREDAERMRALGY